MAYAVSIGTGGYGGKVISRFPTPEQALSTARREVEHGSPDVTITIAATHEILTVDEFEAKLAAEGTLPLPIPASDLNRMVA